VSALAVGRTGDVHTDTEMSLRALGCSVELPASKYPRIVDMLDRHVRPVGVESPDAALRVVTVLDHTARKALNHGGMFDDVALQVVII
jgi:hypothetical protein